MELDKIAQSVVNSCKEFINSSMAVFDKKFADLVVGVREEFQDALGGYVTKENHIPTDEIIQLIQLEVKKLPVAKDGKSVDEAQVKEMIALAVAEKVAAIPVAKDGKDGEDGRDAAHLEILPEIDPVKSYKRGQYAMHKGGLWRTFETTNKMRGWECVVDGISSIEIEGEGREIKMQIVKSSGGIIEKSLDLPVMLYKGVFKEGTEYLQGDNVTFAGSLWYCSKTTKERPGTGSPDWQLAAKRGRDGKGVKGDPGKDGKSGKDAEDPRFLKIGSK